MNQLIKISESENGRAVSARELHMFLEVETPFRKWIDRMFEYGFEEDQDYIRVDKNVRGSQAKEYALTLDCAKEISMLQRSDKGKQARKYFIECERRLSITPNQKLSRKDLAYMVIEAEEKAERLQLEIDTKHKPRSEFVDQVFNSDSLITVGQAAKSLKLEFGRNTLFKKLRESGIFFKNSNEPKQYYVSKGYFEVKEKMFKTEQGDKIKLQTYVTQKGLGFLAKHFGVVQLPINKTKYLSA